MCAVSEAAAAAEEECTISSDKLAGSLGVAFSAVLYYNKNTRYRYEVRIETQNIESRIRLKLAGRLCF